MAEQNQKKVTDWSLQAALNSLKQAVSECELREDRRESTNQLVREILYQADKLFFASSDPLPKGDELHARTWPELQRLLGLNTWNIEMKKHRSPFVFRGMPDKEYKLRTSLQRLKYGIGTPEEKRIEKKILQSFMNYAHGSLNDDANMLEWLTLAQHHGCPTRIMDFTYSPLIALHFATEKRSKDNCDGVIWVVDPGKCREASETYQQAHKLWTQFSKDSYESVARVNQIVSVIEHQRTREKKETPALDKQFDKIAFLDRIECLGDSLVFLEVPSLHQRVISQNHVSAFLTGKTKRVDEWLENTRHMNTFRKIIIDKRLKYEIRDRLYDLGITERLLFPGLDGTCQWLANYYSRSIDISNANVDYQDNKAKAPKRLLHTSLSSSSEPKRPRASSLFLPHD